MRAHFTALALAVIGSLLPQWTAAQTFPDRPVTIVVPYAAGGGVDILARAMGDKLSAIWGKPVIIENKPGSTTILGTQSVTRAEPDGHRLLLTTDSTLTSNPHFFPKLSYDPQTDLTPIAQLATFDLMLLVHPSVKAQTVDELLAFARSSKDGMTYASFGHASQSHVFFAALAKSKALDLTHVPYNGIAPSLRAVIAGEIMMSMAGAGSAIELVLGGQVRALAIARPSRDPRLPDVPTFAEVGLGELDPAPWFGLLAPKGTPLDLRERIYKDVVRVFSDKEFADRSVTARGYVALLKSPQDFEKAIAAELNFRKRQIMLSGIKIDQ